MDLDRFIRYLPLSGVVAVALLAVGVAVMGLSGYRPRGDEAAGIFAADPQRIEAGALIGGYYGLAFMLVFVGSVAGAIWRHGPEPALTAIALAGGVTATVSLAIGFRILNAGAFQAAGPDGLSAELAAVLYRLYASTFAGFVSFALAAFLGATGLAVLRHGFLADWIGWSGLVAAVALLTPAHALGEAFAVFWIAAVSLELTRRQVTPSP
jgi:hypothetical protein